jgi:hypothetical protein
MSSPQEEDRVTRKAPADVGGRFRIYGVVGEGPISTVFNAEDLRAPAGLTTDVAVKVIRREHCLHVEALQQLFEDLRAIDELHHPNIVELRDLGRTAEGEAYVAMERLFGMRLSERLARSGPLTPDQAIHIVVQIADAVALAHRHGLLHRDLRPENVHLVGRHGDPDFVKLTDFGLARLIQTTQSSSGRHQVGKVPVVRTARYLAPEHCQGREVDQRSDVYSLGVLLYHLLAGQPPFIGNGHKQVMFMHVNSPFPAIRGVRPEVSEDLQAVLMRAVAKERNDRWPSMTAFRDALAVLKGDPTRNQLSIDSAAARGRRRRWLGAGLAAAALLVAGVGTLVFTHGQRGGETPSKGPVPTAVALPTSNPSTPAPAPPAPTPAAGVVAATPPSPPGAAEADGGNGAEGAAAATDPGAAATDASAEATDAGATPAPDAAATPVASASPDPSPAAGTASSRRTTAARGRRPRGRTAASAGTAAGRPRTGQGPAAGPSRRPSLGTVDDVPAGPQVGPID